MGCRSSQSAGVEAVGGSGPSEVALNRYPTNGMDDSVAAILPLDEESASSSNLQNIIDAHAHYAAGVVHEMNLEPESALEDYFQAAMLDLTNEPLVLDIAQQFLQARRPEKAIDLLSRASTNSNASSALFAEMGFVYSKLGKTNEAIRADRVAIQKDSRSLAGYQSLFLDYMQNGQTNEIVTLLDEAGKVKGTDAEFLVGLGELYLNFSARVPEQRARSRARALTVLQRAAKLKPTDLRLEMRSADAFNLLDRTDDAGRIYENVIKELPDSSPQYDSVHAKLADIYLHNHEFERASDQLQVILRNNPTDPQTYYLLGGIAYDETNYPKAIEYFRNAILFSPDFQPAYYDMASAQLGTGKPLEALSTLEKARRKFPSSFMAEYLSGVAFSQQKDYTNALGHFTTAEVLAQSNDPKRLTENFYFEFGAASERAGEFTQAEKYFRDCLRLAPDSADALNYLGYMWADRGEKLDEARDMIAKAVKIDPKNAAFLDSMAWVLYKLKQPKPALDYVLKAIQYSTEEDSTVFDHLGDIYSALGQKDKARQAWTKSISLEANDSVQKKLDLPPK